MTTTKRAMVSGLAFGAIVCTSIAGAYHIGYQKAAATTLSDYDAAYNKGFEDMRLNAQKTTDAELGSCNYTLEEVRQHAFECLKSLDVEVRKNYPLEPGKNERVQSDQKSL